MSGIDEIRMESCKTCFSRTGDENTHDQYWTMMTSTGTVLGYYNPDGFRVGRDNRQDKINPVAGSRERIAAKPDLFVDSIDSFVCQSCADRITKEHPDFEMMKTFAFNFVSGDVFPKLRK